MTVDQKRAIVMNLMQHQYLTQALNSIENARRELPKSELASPDA